MVALQRRESRDAKHRRKDNDDEEAIMDCIAVLVTS